MITDVPDADRSEGLGARTPPTEQATFCGVIAGVFRLVDRVIAEVAGE